jgi:hypothetical protein
MHKLSKRIFWIILAIGSTIHAQSTFPGQGIMGKGYNVFGEFANNKSIGRYKLFDFSKMATTTDQFGHVLPDLIYIENISDHIITTVEGNSIEEYSKQLSENMGLSGKSFFFKGSIDMQFKDSYQSNASIFYYTYMDINTKWRASIDTRNVDKMIQYLDEQFKKDLETLSPKEIFELYGTHFISSAYLGGRIDYSSVSQLNSNTTKNDVKLAVTAKYGIVNGNYSLDDNSKTVLSNAKTTTRLSVVGGNSEFTNTLTNNEQYQKWAEGISSEPVLCGFDDKSLVPIWILTTDLARKAQLEDYYNTTILPKYPYPIYFKEDPVLDGKNFVANYSVSISGFNIIEDCDEPDFLGTDEEGDFQYAIGVYQNGELKNEFSTADDRVNKIWSGEYLDISKEVTLNFSLNSASTITVYYKLHDFDDYTDNDVLGSGTITHKFPFNDSRLYNSETEEGYKYWTQKLYNSATCNAEFYYSIEHVHNPTAAGFGNKGWEEYLAGRYDECLNYSRKALEIDNTLWYAQYNVALIYLIQENPRAFEKYTAISQFCGDVSIYIGAYNDIIEYENKHGKIKNSEPIKLLLKSKM